MKANFIISSTSLTATSPSFPVELSCIVGAVSSLLLLSLLPLPNASLPVSVTLPPLTIPEVVVVVKVLEQVSC